MNFRELREHAELTQYRLAKISGVEQTTISQIELGKVRDPRWSTIAALATALNAAPGTVAKAIAQTTDPHNTPGTKVTGRTAKPRRIA